MPDVSKNGQFLVQFKMVSMCSKKPVFTLPELRDLLILCATVVTRGWNGYQNEDQHRKMKILPPLLLGLEPETI